MTTAQSKLYQRHEALHRQRLLGGSFRRTELTFFSLLKLPVVSVLVPFCLVALSSRKLLTQGAGLRCSKRGRVVRRRRTVVQVSWTFNCRTGFSFFFGIAFRSVDRRLFRPSVLVADGSSPPGCLLCSACVALC